MENKCLLAWIKGLLDAKSKICWYWSIKIFDTHLTFFNNLFWKQSSIDSHIRATLKCYASGPTAFDYIKPTWLPWMAICWFIASTSVPPVCWSIASDLTSRAKYIQLAARRNQLHGRRGTRRLERNNAKEVPSWGKTWKLIWTAC